MGRRFFKAVGVALAAGLAAATVLAADKPRMPAGGGGKGPPAGPPAESAGPPAAADETADGKRRLAAGQIVFTPPGKSEWVESEKNRTATRNAFVSADRKAMLVVEVLPTDQKISADMGPPMVGKLKQNRAKSGEKQTQDPAVEKDARFAVRIREHFTAKDGVAGEQLHLYRAVGPRFVYVLCKTFGGEAAAGHLAAAEAASLSAEAAGGGRKRPSPATQPAQINRQ